MLTVIGKAAAIIGLLLLILLGVLLALVLLVLFFPVTYRIQGERDAGHTEASVRMNWLFGLLRLRFFYPEPGNVVVKALWLTLYDSSAPPAAKSREETQKKPEDQAAQKPAGTPAEDNGQEPAGIREDHAAEEEAVRAENERTNETGTGQTGKQTKEGQAGGEQPREERASAGTDGAAQEAAGSPKKIFYTIGKICDKIKQILELLKEEETKALLEQVKQRIGRILWSIRPRKLRAEITYGTGEPDITGYLYGIYGILSPKLGSYVQVTPDFTGLMLEGTFYAAGHVLIIHLLVNLLGIMLDKRLRRFLYKVKQLKKEAQADVL